MIDNINLVEIFVSPELVLMDPSGVSEGGKSDCRFLVLEQAAGRWLQNWGERGTVGAGCLEAALQVNFVSASIGTV